MPEIGDFPTHLGAVGIASEGGRAGLCSQLEWPSSTNADGVCEPYDISYEHPYIPESYMEFAHASFANVWCLTLLIHAVLAALQKALHSLSCPVPGILQAPQAQFFLVSLATPSLMQSSGFVLAHGGLNIYTFLAGVSLASFLFACICLANILRQGLAVMRGCGGRPRGSW
ncbi:hypothetical protein CYMTET_36349 [Cymbomonas tetramitiformis]|uniref:Uncharacterized protein n=1 Tax=Cymbomonas tetramitiformis TaxID=36881 RepID=A0AAE0CHH0_9CHLO|nr:hypothetical protein CYMTET_36349 [Cymbomonas tetramitiformis]